MDEYGEGLGAAAQATTEATEQSIRRLYDCYDLRNAGPWSVPGLSHANCDAEAAMLALWSWMGSNLTPDGRRIIEIPGVLRIVEKAHDPDEE